MKLPSFRLASFDLDGTIVDANGKISSRVQRAIRGLHEKRVAVAIATGRPEFASRTFAQHIGANAPSLYFSGALIYHPTTGQAISAAALDVETVLDVRVRAREAGVYLELYTQDGYFIEAAHPLAALHATYLYSHAEVIEFERILETQPALKLLSITQTPAEEERWAAALTGLKDVTLLTSRGPAHPHIRFGNFTSPSATREKGFSLMIEALGIRAQEVIAFGDSHADIPFLELAGCGVAMGNADIEVRHAAKMVTGSVAEDGVAQALQELGYTISDGGES